MLIEILVCFRSGMMKQCATLCNLSPNFLELLELSFV